MNIKFSFKNYITIFRHPLLGASPWALMNMVFRLKTVVSFPLFAKFTFVFIMSILNTPLILVDFIIALFRKKPRIKAPIFIIGHPRSGTTYLHELMMLDERFYTSKMYEVLFPNYARTYGVLFRYLIQPFLPKKRPQDNVSINLNGPQEEEFGMAARYGNSFIAGFYFPKRFKENIQQTVTFSTEREKKKWQKKFLRYVNTITRKGKSQIILKSPANMARIEAILELFPDAKFIHIHRHPEETFRSTLHLFEEVLPQTSFQKIENESMLDNAFYMYQQFFDVFMDQRNKIDQKHLVEVKFDELKLDPNYTVLKIYKSIGLNVSYQLKLELNKFVKRNDKYKMNKHKKLSPEVILRLKKEAKKVYENYNYS